MYFVMTEATEITIALTRYEDVAEMIAKSFPEKCMIRFIEDDAGLTHKSWKDVKLM